MAHDDIISSGPAAPGGMAVDETSALTRRVTTLSLITASVLIAIKLAAWWLSGSIAMLASLADSGLDLVASFGTFMAVRYAVAPPDHGHRYGHGKAEAFASLLQAGLVFASSALIGEEAIRHLLDPKPIAAEGWAVGVMVASTLVTLWLVREQSRTLKKTSSVAVEGDRFHYLADIAANVVALAGIGAAALIRNPWPDALAGLVIAVWLVWGAVQVFRRSSSELMDAELSDAARSEIVGLMLSDPEVKGVHQLRTRASGPYIHIQMHADLDPNLTLDQAHKVVVAAERRILASYPAADIIIHPDPGPLAEPHGGAFAEEAHHAEAG